MFPGYGKDVQAGEEFRAVAVAYGNPFALDLDGIAHPDVDVVEADDVAVVEADKEVAGKFLHQDAQRLGDGDALFVAEIEVAVTPARLDVEEVTIEVFPKIVVLTDEDAVTFVTGDWLLSRKLIRYKICHNILFLNPVNRFPEFAIIEQADEKDRPFLVGL